MDEFIGKLVKVLSSTVIVRIMSYPAYTIEIFLALMVCVVHFLLIFEVNTLVRRTNAKAATKLRMRRPIRDIETCSFHSLVTLETTQVFHKKPEMYQKSPTYETVLHSPRLQKRLSRHHFGWVLSKGDSILKHDFTNRIEHLLSISPSEYVRRDKERKNREQGLRSCIQSLTSLLEKALTNDSLEIQNMSKDDIKKSINALRENFENQLSSNNYELSNFPSPSLQSLINQSTAKNALQNSLSPNLISSIYHASNIAFSQSNSDMRKKLKDDDEKSRYSVASLRSTESMSEIFKKSSNDFLLHAKRNSQGMVMN